MTARGLQVCLRCSSDFVHPIDGEEAGDHAWRVWLRCAECEWRHEGVYGDAEIEAFDMELDRGTALLRDALNKLELADFEEFGRRFTAALEQDLIGADDFAIRTSAPAQA